MKRTIGLLVGAFLIWTVLWVPRAMHNRAVSSLKEGLTDFAANETQETDLAQLGEAYPQFFFDHTGGWLKVYAWQTAEGEWRCYLMDGFLDALTDQSFVFEVGATVEELRAILSVYDVEKEEIVLQIVKNPLSKISFPR